MGAGVGGGWAVLGVSLAGRPGSVRQPRWGSAPWGWVLVGLALAGPGWRVGFGLAAPVRGGLKRRPG
ncbi:hypothetical protein GCM10010295_20120 [Streptomyces intermedius]